MESFDTITDPFDFDNCDIFNLDGAQSSSDSESYTLLQTTPLQQSPPLPSVPPYTPVHHYSTVVPQYSRPPQPVPQYFDVPHYTQEEQHWIHSQVVPKYFEVPLPTKGVQYHSPATQQSAQPKIEKKSPNSNAPRFYSPVTQLAFDTINSIQFKSAKTPSPRGGLLVQRKTGFIDTSNSDESSDNSKNGYELDTSTKMMISYEPQIPNNNNKNNRKRKMSVEFGNLSERETATLTREELLSFNSDEFEDFVAQISEIRAISPIERNELKKQKRLISNRESAQASRQRKKYHIDQIERKLNDLSEENFSLKDTVESLTNQNKQMRKDMANIQSILDKVQSNRSRMALGDYA